MRLDAVLAYALAAGANPDEVREGFYKRLYAPLTVSAGSSLSELLGVA